MTEFQKIVKYIAMGFAALLAVSIIGSIISAVGFISIFTVEDANTKEMKSYTVSQDIESLYIDIKAADVTLRQGEDFLVESNLKYLKVEEKDGTLSLKDGKTRFMNYKGSKLVVTLPEGVTFKRAELKIGAGRMTAESITAEKLECDFGAGEVNIAKLVATSKARINGGAGEVTVSGGSITDLTLDMGVGELNFTCALNGNCELDLGVGESNITLIGSKDDYTLNIDKGIGSIKVDGDSMSSDISGFGKGENKVDIDGGVGEINVKFKGDA